MPMAMPAIILAAGASTRLGRPKQLVRSAGETLLDRTIRHVRQAGCDPVFVVLGANSEEITRTALLKDAQTIVNEEWRSGISTSIRAGITAVQTLCPESSAAMLLVCDQPNLTSAHLAELISQHQAAIQTAIIASVYAGNIGIPAIFPTSQFDSLLRLEGDVGARATLRKAECPLITIELPGGEFDIDTPEDLASL